MQRVPLNSIVFDAGTQIRAAINESVVSEYAERMAEGVTFPPIVLFHDGNAYYLADGFHRSLGAQRIGWTELFADVRPGTKQDALWFALGANKANGQRLSTADKKHAVLMALRAFPDKSQTLIAEQVGCNLSYVTRIRAEVSGSQPLPDTVEGKDGKRYPATRPTADVVEQRRDERREAVAAMVTAGKTSEAIVEALRVRPSFVAEVRRDLGMGRDVSKAAVAARHQRIGALAAEGYTTRQIAEAVSLTEDRVTDIARRSGIDIQADRVVGKTKRHDSNRIVERMVMDAENLCADVNLIAFDDLDRDRLVSWLDSLKVAREQLGGFIRRLMKEQQKHGEAA